MPIQEGTWKRLPPEEELESAIAEQERHNADLTSYMWYLRPLAEKLGDRVYAVAAKSLAESGLDVDEARLRVLAEEMGTPAGREKYKESRRLHLGHVTG
jgi:hypothetical protein